MTKELMWLTLTVILTGLLWVPYILDRLMVRGLMATLGNPSRGDKPQSGWAQRLYFAHTNAVENLIIFAPLVLILDVSGSMSDYSRSLLQFAYSTQRAASRVEVFCFGTRLTRITRALERRRGRCRDPVHRPRRQRPVVARSSVSTPRMRAPERPRQ